MFSFFRKKSLAKALPDVTVAPTPEPQALQPVAAPQQPTSAPMTSAPVPTPLGTPTPAVAPERKSWVDKLKLGLRKTGASIATVFTGAKIDDALYEDLETALLLADTGVKATEQLLFDLKLRVKDSNTTHPAEVKDVLVDSLAHMLAPLQKSLVIGKYKPTVIMVAGVNGAGKTTSIGKLTSHLASSGATVLLAAADTFRAAAREQLSVWADRNTVDIISQDGGDPAAVSFDAVSAGRARGRDVVLVDTAGRLPTQLHLMEELKKIKRVIQKTGPADESAAKMCIRDRGQGIQVAHPAHNRAAVRRRYKNSSIQRFIHQGVGVVFGAQAALFLDHFKLFFELLVRPLIVGEAVRFELHHLGQPGGGNLLVITRVVAAGEGIFTAAQGRHAARKLARFDRWRALEQHVLQQMGPVSYTHLDVYKRQPGCPWLP